MSRNITSKLLVFCLPIFIGWSSQCNAEVPAEIIEEFKLSRNKIRSLYLKIQYKTESPFDLVEFAKKFNRIWLRKDIEQIAFDQKGNQVYRLKKEKSSFARKDKSGKWELTTEPKSECITVTKNGTKSRRYVPGNTGSLYSKNYPGGHLLSRSVYLHANSLLVDDPIASQKENDRVKRNTLPSSFRSIRFELVSENENEFVIAYDGKPEIKDIDGPLLNPKEVPKGYRAVYTISKTFGYRVKSVVVYSLPEMQLGSTYMSSDFRLVADKIWLPFKTELHEYQDGKLFCKTSMNVLKAELNQDISEHIKFEFPIGTYVSDFTKMTPKHVQKLKQTHIFAGGVSDYQIGANSKKIFTKKY